MNFPVNSGKFVNIVVILIYALFYCFNSIE